MATLKDVARLASVDVSTVSRAINNTSYVHPDTKSRIFAAVKELGYQPNIIAQSLRQGKRHTIGVVVPRLHITVFADIMQGIEEEARRLGYATLICNTEDDPKIERECLSRLRNGFVDGIIIAGTGHNGRLLRDIRSSGLTITQILRQQDAALNSVVVNYENCGYESTKYLASKGCREIGLINGTMKLAPYLERYNGYRRALKELGLSETSAISSSPVNSLEYGYQCALDLLEQNPGLDAIMAAVDAQGIGAMRALKECGIKVPDQIRLISLTGHIIGSMLETTMTSMEMPAREMGVKAALMTISDIESPTEQKSSPQHLVFTSSLVERESS
ncbi:LacI family DNA-binding transcriptional regulator [Clostridium sp. Marseille-P2415]|uniref:LacI family DNA-binding transcriptional regulator n=1 Tax=Clostridium sp. Marseille-P2415 TaxID=1805471 RepID=UPI0009886046|nr:LacI family DNA-binding transcriptional regulator [Clostridium sp. Marseille-P2415]